MMPAEDHKPVFQGASAVTIPAAVLFKQATQKNRLMVTARRVALKIGRRLRCLRSHSPLRGCSCKSALPAAHFEHNRQHAIYSALP